MYDGGIVQPTGQLQILTMDQSLPPLMKRVLRAQQIPYVITSQVCPFCVLRPLCIPYYFNIQNEIASPTLGFQAHAHSLPPKDTSVAVLRYASRFLYNTHRRWWRIGRVLDAGLLLLRVFTLTETSGLLK
jgi:hypothetical protein